MPGLELSRVFYSEAVAPILDARLPGLVYGAGLLGTGSEVLGFDTPRSTDHWWGPRVTIFLAERTYSEALAEHIRSILADELPFEVRGYPTHMQVIDPVRHTVFMQATTTRPLNHLAHVTTVARFCHGYLGVDPLARPLTPAEWCAIPEQHLRTIASGGIWHDGTSELSRLRAELRWYPHDVWLYLLAAQWRRIGQEEAFPGRCAEVDDELGSRVIAARLVREIMHLAFLMERQFMAYSKWLGTAFARLECAARLMPHLNGALGATDWRTREQHLSAAYESVAAMHNLLGITEPVDAHVSPFHGRPFMVIHADAFAEALYARIRDEGVLHLPRWLGNTTQWVDSTDVLSYPRWVRPLSELAAAPPPG